MMQSTLAPYAALHHEADEALARRAAAAAWHREGIILINPGWLRSWADQKQAEILAERLFGKRSKDSTDD
jgi:hypothetical protein